MESKKEQAGKNLNVEKAHQENESRELASRKNGKEGRESGGTGKRARVWRLAPTFRWGTPNKEEGNDAEKYTEQMKEVRRKIKEQQMKHYMRSQIPEPDNHEEFCLIP
ncbi:protein BEX4 [Rhynchocyon petersi]